VTKKYDALAGRRCATCAMFHNPDGLDTGWCVAHPATPFFVGVVPKNPGPLIDPKKPPEMMRIYDSKVVNVGTEDGCWEHKPRGELLN
jgi:hypothetical protein